MTTARKQPGAMTAAGTVMTLRRKIRWLTWIGLIGCLMAAIPALYLLRSGLITERERLTHALVGSAHAMLGEINASIEAGALARDEGQGQARLALRALGRDPFHVSVFTDGRVPEGWMGEGHSVRASLIFEPWGWTIAAASGTGDLDREFVMEALAFVLFIAVLLVLSWPLSVFLSQHVLGPIEALSERMERLTEGQTGIDIPGRDRKDEFGAMARAMDYFRQAAEALIVRDERLFGIMNNIGEAIVLVGEDGLVEEHNPAAVALFGVPGERLDGHRFADLFAEEDRERVARLLGLGTPADGAVAGVATGGRRERAEELVIERADGRIDASLSLSCLDVQGRRSYVCALADMTERLRHERELLRLATRDRLTGLPNRALIESLLDTSIERARRHGRRFAVLCLDLSRFKLITDTLGHHAGDLLLQEVASRIVLTVRASDTVGRIGTDDFAVILDEVGEAQEAEIAAQRILAAFDEPVLLMGTEHYVRPSIGIALFPDHADSAQELVRSADTALYAAKRAGGKRHAFFRKELADQAHRHLALDRDLRAALARGEFQLHYQPKVSLIDQSLEGFEALLRWDKPGFGMIPPGEFIPVAEDTGFIVPLGDWVLDEACRQLREWIDHGLEPVPVAVNISPRHLRQRSAEDFRRIIDRHRLSPDLVELEITEGAVMQDMDHALSVLAALKAMGIRVAVDDFGTGHSSLSYLKRLPVTTLKIDRSFVNGVPSAREDNGIVSTIIAMADMLGLDVVAEGVEKQEQANFLRHHNCTLVQGWLTGRPVPAGQAADLLAVRLRRTA
ncbi:PAS domain S-box-containing protein/diguanylate cyclase (GGDEF)-like protein [Azospirillum brasilense]|uniref:PAS domain S-box-containing protein/diguanylate cyclase (GGDEF)-like protein n=1 Tax=Azospirillum brasilense TaxID=192 RepID=A0A560B3I9_AZOBR|nr:EAL domain-containing protein [Azospirillum brasilense]TWA67200.1 PAS domain S-box-containing protein/diguanylate cyclase (GGDEF)-like protein [Azospirillum brasilense]